MLILSHRLPPLQAIRIVGTAKTNKIANKIIPTIHHLRMSYGHIAHHNPNQPTP